MVCAVAGVQRMAGTAATPVSAVADFVTRAEDVAAGSAPPTLTAVAITSATVLAYASLQD